MSVFSKCDIRVNHKEGAAQRHSSKINAYSDIHFEKHLHFSGRELIITFLASLFTSLCLPLTLPLLSVSNTAKTSALCRWLSLSRLSTTGSSLNGHLMRHAVKRKRSSCHRRTLVSHHPSPWPFRPIFLLVYMLLSKIFLQSRGTLWRQDLFCCKSIWKTVKNGQINISDMFHSWSCARFCSAWDIKGISKRNKTSLQELCRHVRCDILTGCR